MHVSFEFFSIGFRFRADGEYLKGFAGSLVEPPEPGELVLEKLTLASTGEEASFLLDSTIVDQLYEAAYDALFSYFEEERACAAEAKYDERREEERMCRS